MAQLITRTFSLSPLKESRSEVISKLHIGLSKSKELTNIYIRDMIGRLKQNQLDELLFESESKRVVRQQLYDPLNYSTMVSPAFSKYPTPLSERIKQSAFYRALTITRLWLMRNHSLNTCIDGIQDVFVEDRETLFKFLKGENLHGKAIEPLYKALSVDVFGRKQFMTNYFLNNHLKQLKNLLLNSEAPSLKTYMKNTIITLKSEVPGVRHVINTVIENIINSFKEKKKGTYISVGAEQVPSHLLRQFFRKISTSTTYDAKNIILQKKKLVLLTQKTENRNETIAKNGLIQRKRKMEQLLMRCQKRLTTFFPELEELINNLKSSQDLNRFKSERKFIFESKKAEFIKKITLILKEYINGALREKLTELAAKETTQELLLSIFKPAFSKIYVQNLSFGAFMDFFETKIDHAARSELRGLFILGSDDLLGVLLESLKTLKSNLQAQVKIPTAKRLMVQIQDSQNYIPDYDTLTIRLGLCRREFMEFKINDKKAYKNKKEVRSRIQELLNYENIEVKLPIITLQGGKILINLPFEIKKTSGSNRSYPPKTERNEGIAIKVDLGLKHFAVLSVSQKKHDSKNSNTLKKSKEIARYFIGAKEIFDMKFLNGKFLFQEGNNCRDGQLVDSKAKAPSNILLKIRAIRNELARCQKQKAAYRKAHPHDFRTKYKYFRLRRQYHSLWRRIRNLNRTIKCRTSQLILQIANYHNAAHIYFEDLKWSSSQKRAQVGKYLSFMAIHWIHGQIQDHIIQRGKVEGVKVYHVNAAYTSQRCSECGLIEYKDSEGGLTYLKEGLTKAEQKERKLYRTKSRHGKLFTCQNIAMHHQNAVLFLDSDLNASRNIMP